MSQNRDTETSASASGAPPADDETTLARACQALGHPARIRILRLLLEMDRCICGTIVDALPLAQSTVSQHLKILKTAGLIKGEVEGPFTCYCIDRDRLDAFKRAVAGLSTGLRT